MFQRTPSKEEGDSRANVAYSPIDPDGPNISVSGMSAIRKSSGRVVRNSNSNSNSNINNNSRSCGSRICGCIKVLFLVFLLALVLTFGSEYLIHKNGLRTPFDSNANNDNNDAVVSAREQALIEKEQKIAQREKEAAKKEAQVAAKHAAAEEREKAVAEREKAAAAAAAAENEHENETKIEITETDETTETEAETKTAAPTIQEEEPTAASVEEDVVEDNTAASETYLSTTIESSVEDETPTAITEEKEKIDDESDDESESESEEKGDDESDNDKETSSVKDETSTAIIDEKEKIDGESEDESESESEEKGDDESDNESDNESESDDESDNEIDGKSNGQTVDESEDKTVDERPDGEVIDNDKETSSAGDEESGEIEEGTTDSVDVVSQYGTAESEDETVVVKVIENDEGISSTEDEESMDESKDESGDQSADIDVIEDNEENSSTEDQDSGEIGDKSDGKSEDESDGESNDETPDEEEESGESEGETAPFEEVTSKEDNTDGSSEDKTIESVFDGVATTYESPEVSKAWNKMTPAKKKQIENFRHKNAVILNINIPKQGGSGMCSVIGTGAGSTPSNNCVHDDGGMMPDPPLCRKGNSPLHTPEDPPFCYSFKEMTENHKPWYKNQTAPFIENISPYFQMITWKFSNPVGRGEWDRDRSLDDPDWDNPKLVSVVVTRDPMARLLAGDGKLLQKYPGYNTQGLRLSKWWDYAVYDNNKNTDNSFLRLMSTTHRKEREVDQLSDPIRNHIEEGVPRTKEQVMALFPTGIDHSHYEHAKKLLNKFTFVLDIECLEEGMEAMGQMLQMGQIPPQKYGHPTHHETPKERIGYEDVYEYLLLKNEWDIKLYQYSKTISIVRCKTIEDKAVPTMAPEPNTLEQPTEAPTLEQETDAPTENTVPPTSAPTSGGTSFGGKKKKKKKKSSSTKKKKKGNL